MKPLRPRGRVAFQDGRGRDCADLGLHGSVVKHGWIWVMTLGSAGWGLLLLVLGAAGGYFARAHDVNAKPTLYIFDDKRYQDGEGLVYVAGSRTGQGVSYPDNTMAIVCWRAKMQCWMASVEGISKDSCQIGRMEWPTSLPIISWTDQEIVAAEPEPSVACSKLTVVINRKLHATLLIDEPINIKTSSCPGSRTSVEKSTLEDSRWRNLMFGKNAH